MRDEYAEILTEAAELLHCTPKQVPSEIKRLKIQKMHEDRLDEDRLESEGGKPRCGCREGECTCGWGHGV